MKNFFERPKTKDYEKSFLPLISKKININNLDDLKKQKIISLYTSEYEKDFLAYRFELLKQWMGINRDYSKEYIVALDYMVDKLCLSYELNSWEQQYIKNIQAIVFAKNRNLKQLIVDFQINPNEFVFYRYELDLFKQQDKKGLLQLIKDPEMYITTQRIIISKQIDTISINYSAIRNYQFYSGKFILNLKNGKQCFIASENNRAVVESLKRVLAHENIEFNNDKQN